MGKEEKEVELIAANRYNRALVFELQFRPLDALPHLATAYQYRPGEWKYGQEYSYVLLSQNDFSRAEPVLLATVDNARQLAKANQVVYQPDMAGSLINLGGLYRLTDRISEAEAAFRKALDLYRDLVKMNPSAYQPDLAMTLNDVAALSAARSG